MSKLSLPSYIVNCQLIKLDINDPKDLYLIYDYLLRTSMLTLSMDINNVFIIEFYKHIIDQFTLKCNTNNNCFSKRFNSICTYTQILIDKQILTKELLTNLYSVNDFDNIIYLGNRTELSLIFILEWINNIQINIESNSIKVSVDIKNYKGATYYVTLANLLFKILNYILDIVRTESSLLYNLAKGSPLGNMISTTLNNVPLFILKGTIISFKYIDKKILLLFFFNFKGKIISSESITPEIFNTLKQFIIDNIDPVITIMNQQMSGEGSNRNSAKQLEDLINNFFTDLMKKIPNTSHIKSVNDIKNGIPIIDFAELLDLIKDRFKELINNVISELPPEYATYTQYITNLYDKLTFKDIIIIFIILLSLNLYNNISLVKNTFRNSSAIMSSSLGYAKYGLNSAKLMTKNLGQQKCNPPLTCKINIKKQNQNQTQNQTQTQIQNPTLNQNHTQMSQ